MVGPFGPADGGPLVLPMTGPARRCSGRRPSRPWEVGYCSPNLMADSGRSGIGEGWMGNNEGASTDHLPGPGSQNGAPPEVALTATTEQATQRLRDVISEQLGLRGMVRE